MGGVADAISDFFEDAVDFISDTFGALMGALGSPFGYDMDAPDFDFDEGKDQVQAIQGVLLNKDSAISHIPIVYGTRLVGGTRVYVSTNGTNNKFLYVAIVLSEGQCNAYTELRLDDTTVPLSSYAHGVVATPSSGDFSDRLKIQFFDGRDDQVSPFDSSGVFANIDSSGGASGWTTNHRLRGLAYLACRFEWKKIESQEDANNNPYRGIPKIQALLQGRKIYDATTLTADSTTYHDTAYADEPTTFTDNPVSVLLDYMRNSRYGKGLPNSVFNFDTWKSSADLCNQTVTYQSATTGKAFTCNAVVDTSQSLMSNVKIILSGCRGILPYTQGKYIFKIEHGGDNTDIAATPTDPTTVFTVTNDHIIGGINLEGENKRTKINRCRITYVDPDASYQPNEVVYPIAGSSDDTAFFAADNSVRLEKTITLPTITSREQALQYAEVFVKRSRTAKVITFGTNLATSNTSVGDLIRVINEHISLDGIFRISDIRINPHGHIEITGIEHTASNYAINAKTADITRPSINLPNPNQVIAPTSLVLASGAAQNLQGAETTGYFVDDSVSVIRRLKVSWTATTDPYVSEYIVQFKKTSDSDYATAQVTSDVSTFIFPVGLGQSYDVRVAAKNELARRSDFIVVTGHTIVA